MIGTELRDDLFVDYIGNRLGVKGFESITGLKQNITIPVQTTTSTPKGKKLNQAAEASTINVVPKTLSPKRITTYIDIGKDLILQGVPSAEAKVINDLTKSLACATDIALFRGYAIDSDTKIKGVLETDGLNTVTIADMSKATWADMVKFAAHVEGKDYSGSSPAWVGSASDKGNFKCISKDAGSGRFILEDNQIDGYAYNVDGNAAAGELVFGYWNALTLAQWAGLEILIDPYTLGTKGMLRIVGSIYVDACVTAPSLFVKRVAE
jgi:HK97 family phage major capsid protein